MTVLVASEADVLGWVTPILWPFQERLIADIQAEVERGNRRILVVSATGSGKTITASALASNAVAEGQRVLFLDHRVELTEQAAAKLFAAGIDAGIIQAGFRPRPEWVQVASVQTLHARAVRGRAMKAPDADLVIVDEAHHVRARTYERILDLYPRAVVIGLTATPCRGDGRGLGNSFDVIVEAPQIAERITGGYLVPARIYAPEAPDLTGVRIERGDYREGDLAESMDKPQLVGDIVEHWLRLAARRRTVVFATGVGHSVHLRDEFRRSGVVAEHIDGNTPADERKAILKRLATGEVEVICNCAVLTEGFDCPDMGALVLARPTKSLGLFRQMVGRVLRAAPGKTDAIILDHAGAVYEHGLPDGAERRARGHQVSGVGPARVVPVHQRR
jgi:superfamily II DNA or RNA helicase